MRRAVIVLVAAGFIILAIVVARRRAAPAAETSAPPQVADKASSDQPGPAPKPSAEAARPGVADGAAPLRRGGDATATEEAWRKLTQFDFAALPVAEMPPDDGYVAPIAADDQKPNGSTVRRLAEVEAALATWAPGRVADPVQRVRNFLLLLGVVDVAQSPLERFLPDTIVRQLLKDIPAGELAQLMCWVALHPEDGDTSVLADPMVVELGELDARTVDVQEARNRTYIYGVKLTRRLIGW